jgi:soluble lytic murein transglycosylase-like protein
MKRLFHLTALPRKTGRVQRTAPFALIGVLVLPVAAWAGEHVVLGNGSRLYADRHETVGGWVRIFTGGGVVEVPQTAVAGYEQEEIVAAVPSPPVAVADQKLVPTPAPAAIPATPAELAAWAAKKYHLPDSFVRSVMKAESGFQPNAISPKGAIGLMQLMPDTARVLGVDPRDPHQNADGGAQYLRQLLARYENDPNQVLLALAAYNAGPAAVDRYHGVPPYKETREYILRVLKNWDQTAK